MPTPVVSDIERVPVIPVGRSEEARIDEEVPHFGRLDGIVDSSAQSVVDSRDVAQEIEEEEEEEDYQLPQGFAASLKKLLPQRRVQALAIGAGAVALLFAALAAHSDAPNDETHLNPSEVGSSTDPLSVNAVPAGNVGSPVTGSSNGAIEQRSFGSGASERNDRTIAAPTKGNQPAGEGSLVLGNLARTPTADIATLRSDSIVRATASLKTDGAASAIQLIASGSEKKLVTPDFSDSKGGPTRAKLRGAMPQPLYPDYLRKVGVRGEVVVQFTVDETGHPEMASLKVMQSPHEFLTDEVRRAILKMRFDPAHTGGANPKPTADLVQISFVFDALTK
jgi:TonB family protein